MIGGGGGMVGRCILRWCSRDALGRDFYMNHETLKWVCVCEQKLYDAVNQSVFPRSL